MHAVNKHTLHYQWRASQRRRLSNPRSKEKKDDAQTSLSSLTLQVCRSLDIPHQQGRLEHTHGASALTSPSDKRESYRRALHPRVSSPAQRTNSGRVTPISSGLRVFRPIRARPAARNAIVALASACHARGVRPPQRAGTRPERSILAPSPAQRA